MTVKASALAAGTPVAYGQIVEWQGRLQADIFWGGERALIDKLTEQTPLGAALGVNRPDTGGRTAPSAHNWQEIEVHDNAIATGLCRYERCRALVAAGRVRRFSRAHGNSGLCSDGLLDLVYIADFSRMKDTDATALARSNVVRGAVVRAPDELLASTEGARRVE